MRSLIFVTALTYKRPQMLSTLLAAWRSLKLPKHAHVKFLIIDNDPAGSAYRIIQSFTQHLDHQLLYVVEPRPGIPAARNRALDVAKSGGADFLCFNDDDGYPNPNWLDSIVRCQAETRAHLTLGPYRLALPPDHLSKWQRIIAGGLIARQSFVERFAENESRKGRIVTSGASNWMANVPWIMSKGIRFSNKHSETGGEDTIFREEVSNAGGRLAWCPNAIVYENLQTERIGLRYQLKRARAQGINAYHVDRKVYPRVLQNPFGRLAIGAGLLVLPVLGKASFMLGLHLIGMAVGILQARWGAESNLYTRPD